jgi:esterase/lipase superfamily enzyme
MGVGRHLMLPSSAMGRDVHVWQYGWFGEPMVVFPTAAGFAHEWQAQGMIDVLAPLIGAGKIKLYCPESNVSEAWTKKEVEPATRIKKHQAYERFVMDTLVPFIRQDCRLPQAKIAVTGASLGGMYAANFALKHPETFHWSLSMSGRYLATEFTGGFQNGDIYHNNPLAYVPNLGGDALQRIRDNTHLVMVCGTGKWEEGCIEETIALCDVFQRKGISHQRDIWGRDSVHDWGWWKKQAWLHLNRRFG